MSKNHAITLKFSISISCSYLKNNQIVGIQGIDTRYLTKIIRDEGAMNGIISSKELNDNKLKKKLKIIQK